MASRSAWSSIVAIAAFALLMISLKLVVFNQQESHSTIRAAVSSYIGGIITTKVDCEKNRVESCEIEDLKNGVIKPPGSGFVHPAGNTKVSQSQEGQDVYVDKLLGQKRGGFYLEVGGSDGFTLSNTLFLETEREWSGLLIEADPNRFKTLLSRNRRVYSLKACLSPTEKSGPFEWLMLNQMGGLKESHVFQASRKKAATDVMYCYAFGSVMAALGVTRVDYFSLDIEGAEIPVLKTIPWTTIYIDVITVEYRCFSGEGVGWGYDLKETRQKLIDIDSIVLGTGLFKRIAILPGGTNMTQAVMNGGLDVVYKHV